MNWQPQCPHPLLIEGVILTCLRHRYLHLTCQRLGKLIKSHLYCFHKISMTIQAVLSTHGRWVNFDFGVPLICPYAQLQLSNSHQCQQNWVESCPSQPNPVHEQITCPVPGGASGRTEWLVDFDFGNSTLCIFWPGVWGKWKKWLSMEEQIQPYLTQTNCKTTTRCPTLYLYTVIHQVVP